jgi:hypothetical protein
VAGCGEQLETAELVTDSKRSRLVTRQIFVRDVLALHQTGFCPMRYDQRVRSFAAASLALLLSACIMDGRYVVRGSVVTASGAEVAPANGATVNVGHASGEDFANGFARTSADGRYAANYAFGGMFPFIAGSNPVVEFAAPGYRTCKVDLRGASAPTGVTRRSCDPPEPGCFVLDVVLTEESSAP